MEWASASRWKQPHRWELLGYVPYFAMWLRYTGFIVLYPLGVASELTLAYLALPTIKSSGSTMLHPLDVTSELMLAYFALPATKPSGQHGSGSTPGLVLLNVALHSNRKKAGTLRHLSPTCQVQGSVTEACKHLACMKLIRGVILPLSWKAGGRRRWHACLAGALCPLSILSPLLMTPSLVPEILLRLRSTGEHHIVHRHAGTDQGKSDDL
eukprot:scaffold8745_cov19-Tisochrysis_lutea.AAC.1